MVFIQTKVPTGIIILLFPDLQGLRGTHLELRNEGLIVPELDLQLLSLLLARELFPEGAVSLHP